MQFFTYALDTRIRGFFMVSCLLLQCDGALIPITDHYDTTSAGFTLETSTFSYKTFAQGYELWERMVLQLTWQTMAGRVKVFLWSLWGCMPVGVALCVTFASGELKLFHPKRIWIFWHDNHAPMQRDFLHEKPEPDVVQYFISIWFYAIHLR